MISNKWHWQCLLSTVAQMPNLITSIHCNTSRKFVLLSLINEYCKLDVPSNLVSGIITLVIGSSPFMWIQHCQQHRHFYLHPCTVQSSFHHIQTFHISRPQTLYFFQKLPHWTHNSESLDAALLSVPIHDTNYLWNYSSSVSICMFTSSAPRDHTQT